jgi:hypothetical protein
MLDKEGWQILRDSSVLRSGELISGFMKRIGLADHVIVVLSDKYLRSPYCMTELHSGPEWLEATPSRALKLNQVD